MIDPSSKPEINIVVECLPQGHDTVNEGLEDVLGPKTKLRQVCMSQSRFRSNLDGTDNDSFASRRTET